MLGTWPPQDGDPVPKQLAYEQFLTPDVHTGEWLQDFVQGDCQVGQSLGIISFRFIKTMESPQHSKPKHLNLCFVCTVLVEEEIKS